MRFAGIFFCILCFHVLHLLCCTLGAEPLSAILALHQRLHPENVRAQMFKVVLSKVFDLRCNLEEIAGVGEPLLLFKGEGEAAARGKGGSAPAPAPSNGGKGGGTTPK